MSSYITECGVLGNPPGGTADSSGGTTYGSVATFTCDLGYTMTGTATSTCQADESWDNLDPGCQINGTVKPVLSDHSKIGKTKVLKTNGSLMQVKCIAECSLGAFCNKFDLH